MGLIFNSIIVADWLIHVLRTGVQILGSIRNLGLGDIIDSLIVADWVIMTLPHFCQRLVIMVHLVSPSVMVMVSPRVRCMVSNDDVVWLLLESISAGEVRAKPAKAWEATLVNLTKESKIISPQGAVAYRQDYSLARNNTKLNWYLN